MIKLARHRKHPDRWYVEVEVPASEGAEAVNASPLDTLSPHSEEVIARDDVADDSCVVCFEWALEAPPGVSAKDYRAMRKREAALLVRGGRDRMQAEERLRSAQEQLKVFRERERAMNDALVAAQQLREDSRQQAERESELILKEAKSEAHRIVEQARQDEVSVRARADSAARQFSAYLAGFRGLLQRQLAELDVLEGHARTIVEVQAGDMARSRE